MPQRKVWTQEEDRVLKFLKEVRGVAKWSVISQTMEKQFNIVGRNGKQCRERYHNHLDKSISNSQWTIQQENKLFEIQDEVGNKWALISSKLPGRTDNCVKNHFYSKLRKGLRKLNKKIHKHFKRVYKEIKTATLYKIIQTIENKGKTPINGQLDTFQLQIKKQIKEFEGEVQKIQNQHQELEYIKNILDDIALFQPQIKKIMKKSGLKSSKKLEDENSSQKPLSNKVSSTKSVYDEEQSEYSNSQLYSSSSFGQQSFHSNRSQSLLKPLKMIHRSHSIPSQTQSEDQQYYSSQNILYKSANSLSNLKNNFKTSSQGKLFGSLKLPESKIRQISQPVKEINQNKSMSSEKSDKSRSPQAQKIFQCGADHMNMIGEQQNFPTYMKMRLFSPKKPSYDDIMEMNDEKDQLFYGQKMEIDCQNLIQNFSGLGLNDMPKLGHTLDI